jgi:alkylhydroperoxidase family enzyme
MPWIKTVPPQKAEGRLQEVYEMRVGPSASRGHVSPIRQVQSLNPEALYHWMHLNNAILYGESGLSRVEREMIATVVSSVNSCSF